MEEILVRIPEDMKNVSLSSPDDRKEVERNRLYSLDNGKTWMTLDFMKMLARKKEKSNEKNISNSGYAE